MRAKASDLLLTAIAPAIWGSTYIVTTEFLPNFSPITVAMLRALPAGSAALDPLGAFAGLAGAGSMARWLAGRYSAASGSRRYHCSPLPRDN
jgi:drug/metabolite transporter (DMT)-like permease